MNGMELDLYQQHVRKLKDYCNQMGLDYKLDCSGYPITLTLTPTQYYRQMSMFTAEDSPRNHAVMIFTLRDGEIQFSAHKATVSDATFGKLKGLFDKISRYWTQFVYQAFAQAEDKSMFAELWRNALAEADND